MAEKENVKVAATVSLHNRGIRLFHLPDGKGGKLTLGPGQTVEVPAEVAALFTGANGYRELIDAAKLAPGQAKKMADLQSDNARLQAELDAEKAKSAPSKPDEDAEKTKKK